MEIDGVHKRKVARELYDRQKTIQLQDDEIERLNAELKRTLQRVADREDHANGCDSIYKARITDLRSCLSGLRTQTSLKRTKMISAHTVSITALRERHQIELERLRREYELKLVNLAEGIVQEDKLAVSIDSTRLRIAETLRMTTEKKELRIRERMQNITVAVDRDRSRVKQLRESIAEMKRELAKTKDMTQYKVANMDFPEIDTKREEEHLLFEKANMISEENVFRREAHDHIECLKCRITEVRTEIANLKQRTRESETQDSGTLAHANRELDNLEQTHKAILLQRKEIDENGNVKKMRHERHKATHLSHELSTTRDVLKQAQNERAIILKELKRLDFMVYGTRGKYQKSSM